MIRPTVIQSLDLQGLTRQPTRQSLVEGARRSGFFSQACCLLLAMQPLPSCFLLCKRKLIPGLPRPLSHWRIKAGRRVGTLLWRGHTQAGVSLVKVSLFEKPCFTSLSLRIEIWGRTWYLRGQWPVSPDISTLTEPGDKQIFLFLLWMWLCSMVWMVIRLNLSYCHLWGSGC